MEVAKAVMEAAKVDPREVLEDKVVTAEAREVSAAVRVVMAAPKAVKEATAAAKVVEAAPVDILEQAVVDIHQEDHQAAEAVGTRNPAAKLTFLLR